MNPDDLFGEIVAALKGELGTGFNKIKKFVETDAKLMAKHTAWIAQSRIEGVLANDDAFYEWHLEGLKRDTVNMAKTVAVLTALTIEQAWNAVANVIWGALSKTLTAAGLPAPLIPSKPPKI